MNNFHYHNAVDDDYHWCSHYQTLVIACCEAAVAKVDRNLNVDFDRIDGDCNEMMLLIHWSYFDDDNVDELVAVAVDL